MGAYPPEPAKPLYKMFESAPLLPRNAVQALRAYLPIAPDGCFFSRHNGTGIEIATDSQTSEMPGLRSEPLATLDNMMPVWDYRLRNTKETVGEMVNALATLDFKLPDRFIVAHKGKQTRPLPQCCLRTEPIRGPRVDDANVWPVTNEAVRPGIRHKSKHMTVQCAQRIQTPENLPSIHS